MEETSTTKKVTLFSTIRETIQRSILSGNLKPGDKLPTEEQLTVKFNASRPTVNKAIRSLARDGFVETRKRGGTIVLGQTQSWIPMIDINQYVSKLGKKYSFELLRCEEIRNKEGNVIWSELEPGSDVLSIECVHYSGAVPIQHEQRVINLNALPHASDANFISQSPSTWLQRNAPWPTLTQTIGVAGAGEVIADRLNVRYGTPCIGIHQIARSTEKYLTMVTFTSPAGRFSITTNNASQKL